MKSVLLLTPSNPPLTQSLPSSKHTLPTLPTLRFSYPPLTSSFPALKHSLPPVKFSNPPFTHPARPLRSPFPTQKSSLPPPKSSQPPPKSSQPPPKSSQPPPKSSQPPPKSSHPSPKSSHPPPDSSHPPPNSSHPPPKSSHPPLTSSAPLKSSNTPLKVSLLVRPSQPPSKYSNPPLTSSLPPLSNGSRMMSPDLHHPGSHLDFGRRRVTVKPYEEEDEEDQPVYTRMQKESVIEREIRLAREREEAYRREKGLITTTTSQRPAPAPAPATTPAPAPATAPARGPAPVPAPATAPAPAPATATAPQRLQLDGRDVQHRMATSRIQLEIQETSMKEKELRDAGKILTMSEDTVDSKVTRMSDFSDMSHLQQQQQQPLDSPRTHNSISPRPSSTTPASTPKRSPSPRSPASPVPNFTPSPALNRNGLSRSLSTNNLSTTSSTILPNPRAPKGLMQKFIASRGKMTGSAFASPPPTLTHTTSTSRGVPTRPMRVEPKAAVVQREALAKIKPELATANSTAIESYTQHQKQMYRRSYCTAEEKIQSELKEMQMREEELRRLRAFQMAQSQPNLLDVAGEEEHDFTEEEESNHSLSDMSSLRSALSNPNLLEEPEQTQVLDKGVRRRSALIAQWENRIQQTTDT